MKFKLQKDERALVNKFVKCFIPGGRQPRWETILGSDSSKWEKLSMDDLWKNVDSSAVLELIDIEKYMSINNSLASQSALLIKLSGGGLIEKGNVSELIDQLVFDDSIIIVFDVEASFASHHSGEWVLCSTRN